MGVIGRLIGVIVMLIVEVSLTLLAYASLDLFSRNTFGLLVNWSERLLNEAKRLLPLVLRGQDDQAYASLLGDLSPKAILLLLIGLVVAAILRGFVELLGLRGRQRG